MHLARHAFTAGLMAVSLGVCAAPAVAKGGGDINNTVVSIAPGAPGAPGAPATGGGGGGGRAPQCAPTGGIDPVTGSTIMVCTTARP